MAVIEMNPPFFDLERIGEKPVIFLAGPIQGAPDWQADAIELIGDRAMGEVVTANPRSRDFVPHTSRDQYVSQAGWEQAHLRLARDFGGVLFWLASETPDAPSPNKPGRAYAQTTRIEYGKVTGWLDYQTDIAVSFGMEGAYKGSEKYYDFDIAQYDIPIKPTLEETVDHLMARVEEIHGAI